MGNLVYINGKFLSKNDAKISVFDHGLLYGDGIFETMRSYNGKVFKVGPHLSRLYKNARIIKIKIPISKKALKNVSCHIISNVVYNVKKFPI